MNEYTLNFPHPCLNFLIDSLLIMDGSASFWNKVEMPSFINVIWSKLTGSASAGVAGGLRKLQAGRQKPATLPPNCALSTSQADLEQFCAFLRSFYNTSTQHQGPAPISTLTPDLMKVKNLRPIILRLADDVSGSMAPLRGCISSQPIGRICRWTAGAGADTGTATVSDFPLRLISNFCIHPNYRKSGHGSQLLNAVWADLIQLGEDACIFLKEGQPLLTAGPPLMSGRWIYRYCDQAQQSQFIRQIPATSLFADSLIEKYAHEKPNVLFNKGCKKSQTLILEYRGLRGSILAAFSSAVQVHSLNNKPIYYQTGWLENGDILITERVKAAREISDFIGGILDGAWVWCDWSITNNAVLSPWRLDGPYQYYSFQWSADLYGTANLFLRL